MRCSAAAVFLFIFLGTMGAASAQERSCTLDYPLALFAEKGDYHLNKKTGTATEQLALGDGTTLKVLQSGCEYSNVTYRFELLKKPDDIGFIGAEYKLAIRLLDELQEQLPGQDFADAKHTLGDYLYLVAEPRLKESLFVRHTDTDFSEEIMIDGRLDKAPYYIEISLSSGPY